MLIAARQARVPLRFAPVVERRASGTALVRGQYGPSIAIWLHPHGLQAATGTSAAAVNDFSDKAVSIAQTTASKRPVSSAVSGTPGFAFDGVDDYLNTGAINLSGTNQITILAVHYIGNGKGMLIDVGAGDTSGAVTGGFNLYRNFFTGVNYLYSDSYVTTYNERRADAVQSAAWIAHGSVIDRTQNASGEITLYQNGTALASTLTFNNDLNANFENRVGTIGGWAPNAFTFGGSIAQLVVVRGAFSATQMSVLTTSLRLAAGV